MIDLKTSLKKDKDKKEDGYQGEKPQVIAKDQIVFK